MPGPDEIDDSAPPSDSGGIKDIKPDPAAVRDALGALNKYLKGVVRGMPESRPHGSQGGSNRKGPFNPKTGRGFDFLE